MTLTDLACIPCRSPMRALTATECAPFLAEIPNWRVSEDSAWLTRDYAYPDFAGALAAVNRMGAVAEQDGHHPDLAFGWGYVRVRVQTHAASGLTKNDFILAAKLENAA